MKLSAAAIIAIFAVAASTVSAAPTYGEVKLERRGRLREIGHHIHEHAHELKCNIKVCSLVHPALSSNGLLIVIAWA